MEKFKAESQKILDMMIHSIYTNKDIFLRELISNASDAIDKMYVKSLTDKDIHFDRTNFYIELVPDKEKRTLTIKDSGIGMDKEELDRNLGTIAHSGSLDFKKANSTADVSDIIGQFGVGFYSAFMVADQVTVTSRKYGEDQAWQWMSDGVTGYEIQPADKEEVGTDICLRLKKNEEEEDYDHYLEEYTLEELVKSYSNYIRYPIRMEVSRTRKVEKPEKEGAAEDEKPEYEEYQTVETLNSMTPIWNQDRKELKEEDYINFYQQEHFGFDQPLAWTHMVVDGMISYRAILYIPSQLPYNYYSRDYDRGLELYSRGVKIMDHCEELLPDYFGFIRGVVSSDDLSLNLSREEIQQDRQLRLIARGIEKRIGEELKKMMEEDAEKYRKFFALFGRTLKFGIYETFGGQKDKLAPLLIFPTSLKHEGRSLDEIIAGPVEAEKKDGEEGAAEEADGKAAEAAGEEAAETEKSPIYYASGESIDRIENSPAMEGLKEKGIEVLYAVDRIDEFAITTMNEYQGHPFQSILSSDFSLEGEKKEEEAEDSQTQDIFKAMKDALGDEVTAVKPSRRLVEDAVVLVAQGPISIDMEKTFMDQPEGSQVKAQKVLEVNRNHPLYKKMAAMYQLEEKEKFNSYTRLLYDQARLIAGLPVDDPMAFAKAVQELMEK